MSIFYTDVSHRGGKIYLRYIDGNTGARRQRVIEFKPELYIRSNDNKTCDAKSMWDEPLSRIEFESTREMNGFMEQYKDVDGFNIYGMRDPIFQFITKMFKGKIEHNSSHIRGCFVDIEVFSGDIDADGKPIQGPFPKPDTAEYPINAISLYSTADKTFHVWGLEVFKGVKVGTYKHNHDHPKIGKLKIDYRGFESEHKLLEDFADYWAEYGADYWTGWNIQGFDNPYLTNRIEKVCGVPTKKKLSPWGIVNTKTTPNNFGDEDTYYQFFGMAMLDYLDLFKKHAFKNPDNMRLETVGQLVLGEGKIDYTDAGNLNTLYITDYQKFIEYNIQDTNLIVMMDEKQKFIDLTFTLGYLTKSNYEDTLGTIRPWSALAYSMLHERGEEPLLRPLYSGDIRFAGGFVKEPKPNIYKWVVSVDLNSLYPHLIQQYNLGIETIVEPQDLPDEIRNLPSFTLDDLVNKTVDLSVLKKYDLIMTANRQFFRKDRMAIFNEKTRDIYSSRKVVKKEMLGNEQKLVNLESQTTKTENIIAMLGELEMLIASGNNLQQALKILMNGLYGGLSNRYFKEFFDLRIAEGVTLSGQLSIIWIARKLDEYFNNILKLGSIDYKVICSSNPPETILQTTGNGHRWVHYVDTDSVAGDSLVYANGEKLKIEDLYASFDGEVEERSADNFIKKVSNIKTLSYGQDGSIHEREINYVMKHRVKKRMFKIKVDGKEVVVTEDHSIIVERNGKLTEAKPSEIIDGDVIITI